MKILLYYMEMIKINSKGQIVIPQKIRKEFEITEESILVLDKMKNHIIIKKIDSDLINQIERSLEDIKAGRIKEWKG
ncbi:MAG: AbrB/MazE/SpoVT family DNA-binding domain-containing protein [Nanoarchaeota archaeon]|nr:AbrB/MazE/SpoVT family DNA-binding domain-containing protein [Nanoarchaeota archaeon]